MKTFERRQIKWAKSNHFVFHKQTKWIKIVCLSIVNVLVMPINSDGVNSLNKTKQKMYNKIHFQNKNTIISTINHQPSSFHQTWIGSVFHNSSEYPINRSVNEYWIHLNNNYYVMVVAIPFHSILISCHRLYMLQFWRPTIPMKFIRSKTSIFL